MNRFDIHVNLRAFAGSRRGKQQRDVTPEDMAQYFETHSITHSLVLYNRDDYKDLEKLSTLTSTKIYGVQCMFGPTQEDPTDIDTIPELDVNVEGRSFLSGGHCYGVKFASERGWWKRGDEVQSGMCYNKDKIVRKVLDQLPKNAIVSMHTQGTSKPDNTSRPMMLTVLATKYTHLKFIINHTGDYGPSATIAKPSVKRILNGEGMSNLLRHVSHRMIIRGGLEATQWYHNLFGDMSCCTPVKAYMAKDYDQWCAGSDYPFSENFDINYTNERKMFEKCTDIPDDNAVHFFETDIDQLMTERLEWHQEYFDNQKEFRNDRKEQQKLSEKG